MAEAGGARGCPSTTCPTPPHTTIPPHHSHRTPYPINSHTHTHILILIPAPYPRSLPCAGCAACPRRASPPPTSHLPYPTTHSHLTIPIILPIYRISYLCSYSLPIDFHTHTPYPRSPPMRRLRGVPEARVAPTHITPALPHHTQPPHHTIPIVLPTHTHTPYP